ncbi:CHC2 zinc finger domain-containing protein [Acidobacteria bacterium AH-259-D05]|nr:CHC2 zinc finger domain-containing protein [Acidobacteria bacterium AH-259-D05]
MKNQWVDFQEVKRVVTMRMLLEHYGVNWLRKSGDELRGRCPLHEGEGERAFHVNLSKNVFHCFSCKAKGNVLDFVIDMEGVSVRAAALKLQDWFMVQGQQRAKRGRRRPAKGKPREEKPEAAGVINPPLGFKLRVDPGHEYGEKRGLAKEILEQFGAGFCLSKGMLSGRFVFPLHDDQGRLVGYAGRSLDDSEPKYLFPSSEKGFHKKYLLFNLHREMKEIGADEPVVVVEGFFDCLRIKALGYPCVALLGSSLSEEQEELMASYFNRVILLLDGDEAGRAATDECLRRLGQRIFVKALMLPEGKQPDMMSRDEVVLALLKGSRSQVASPT